MKNHLHINSFICFVLYFFLAKKRIKVKFLWSVEVQFFEKIHWTRDDTSAYASEKVKSPKTLISVCVLDETLCLIHERAITFFCMRTFSFIAIFSVTEYHHPATTICAFSARKSMRSSGTRMDKNERVKNLLFIHFILQCARNTSFVFLTSAYELLLVTCEWINE